MFEALKRSIAKAKKELEDHHTYFHHRWQRQPRFWVGDEEESFAEDEKKGAKLKKQIQETEEMLKKIKERMGIKERIGMRMFGRLFRDLDEVTETYEQMEPLFLWTWESNPRSEDALAQYEAESGCAALKASCSSAVIKSYKECRDIVYLRLGVLVARNSA